MWCFAALRFFAASPDWPHNLWQDIISGNVTLVSSFNSNPAAIRRHVAVADCELDINPHAAEGRGRRRRKTSLQSESDEGDRRVGGDYRSSIRMIEIRTTGATAATSLSRRIDPHARWIRWLDGDTLPELFDLERLGSEVVARLL
jgi:hypothetical protein